MWTRLHPLLDALGLGRGAAYRELLRRSRGDREQVERLIEHERSRDPAAAERVLAERALYRWTRDAR